MKKSSTAYLLECYIWLVNTLARGPISRKEIDVKWAHSSVNDYKQDYLPESNFHRWKNTIELLFDITIKCNSNNEYYIAEMDDSRNPDLHNRLISMIGVNSLLKDSKELRDKIIFEPVPSGEKFLSSIIEALRDQCAIQMTYQSFSRQQPATFPVEPYCLKMFKQRWYMVAYSPDIDSLRIYSLDRVHAIESTKQRYKIPANFDAERYFKNTYGVTGMDDEPEEIRISIDSTQANYLRTLPLHPSQEEIERNTDYSIFRYLMVPSYEFKQELYKYGSDLEVLEPQWLRDEFHQNAKDCLEFIYERKE